MVETTINTTVSRLAELVAGITDEVLRRKPTEDFSIIENVCHLRDIEREGHLVRIRRLLSEENPLLTNIDGERIAIDRRYGEQDVKEAVADFSAAREKTLALLSEVKDFERSGVLETVGRITLGDLVKRIEKHDAEHLTAIADILHGGQ